MKNYKRKPIKKQSIRFADISKRGGYVNTPTSFIRSPHLSMGAKLIYQLFHTYAWEGDKCYPGHRRIAAVLGIKDVRTVRTYLKELKDHLLIDWEGKSELNTNVYEILEVPTVLLEDSKLSLKMVSERLTRLKEKHEGRGRVQKLHPTLGTKNVPLSTTHASNTHSENFFDSNHEDTKSSPALASVGSESEARKGGVKARTSKRLLKYEPLTDIQVYELAKEFSVHPLDVREVSKSAIAEFESGKIVKPVGTYETTKHFLGFRTSLSPSDPRSIEVLGNDFQYMIEDAHPLNKALKKKHSLELKAKSLKGTKKTVVGFRLMLENGPIEPGKLPQFLASYGPEEHLEVVNQRIQEINLEGKNLFSQYKVAESQAQEMEELYPERRVELLA